MGEVGGELLQALVAVVEAFEHGVERLCHLLQLGRRGGDVEAGIQAGRMDLRRLRRQRAQRAQAVAQDQPAEQGGAKERQQHGGDDPVAVLGEHPRLAQQQVCGGDLQRLAAADQTSAASTRIGMPSWVSAACTTDGFNAWPAATTRSDGRRSWRGLTATIGASPG